MTGPPIFLQRSKLTTSLANEQRPAARDATTTQREPLTRSLLRKKKRLKRKRRPLEPLEGMPQIRRA